MDLRDKATFKRVVLVLFIAALFLWCAINHAVALKLILYTLSLFTPLIVGACMAFVFNVILKLLEEKIFIHITVKADPQRRIGRFWRGFVRPLSLLLTIFIVFGIIIMLIALLVPQLKHSIQVISYELPTFINYVQGWLDDSLKNWGFENVSASLPLIDWNAILSRVVDFLSGNSGDVISNITSFTSGVFGVFFNVGVGFIFSIYILLQKEKLIRQVTGIIYSLFSEKKADTIFGLGKLSNEIFGKFITGQFIEAIIIGTLCFTGMSLLSLTAIFEFPYALMISVIVGFTSLIPVVGAFIGTSFGALLIVMQDPIQALWFILFIIVLQQIESNLIYPKVIGKSIGLPGIWVLLAVIVGGSVYGIMGVIIGIPLCSVVYILLRNWIKARLKKKNIDIRNVEARDMKQLDGFY